MPTNFNGGNLATVNPQEGQVDPGAGRVDYTSVGKVAASVIDAFKPVKDDGSAALAQYATDASDIVQSTQGYVTERERLENALATTDPKDKEALTRYSQELSRLRKGEMSPLTASARLNKLTKDHILLNPQLTTKILAIKNGFMSDVTSVAGESAADVSKEADLKAQEEIGSAAASKGWTYQEEISLRRAQTTADVSKLQLEAMQRTGTLNEAAVADSYLTNMQVFYKQVIPDIVAKSKDPNFSGPELLGQLYGAKSQIILSTNKLLSSVALKNNMILSKDFQANLLAQSIAPLDQMIEIAKSVDNPKARAALSENLRTISENNDLETLRKRLGPMATMLKGTDSMIEWASFLFDTNNKIKQGMLKELEATSKYNPKLAMALAFIKGDEYDQDMANAVDDAANGRTAIPSGNDTIDKIKMQGGYNYALAPSTTPKDAETALVTLNGQPGSFEAYDNRPDLVNKSKGIPAAIESLKAASPKQLVEYAGNDVSLIQFDALNNKEPFSVAGVSKLGGSYGKPGDPTYAVGGIYGEAVTTTSPKTKELVSRLNQQYRVFSNFMSRPEAQKWAATTFDDLKATSNGITPEPNKKDTSLIPGLITPGTVDASKITGAHVIESGDKFVVIPDTNPKGVALSATDAETLYTYTGNHLGIFNDQDKANNFAARLNELHKNSAPPKPVDNKEIVKAERFGRFSVDPNTGAVADSKKGVALSPPAIQRLLDTLSGTELDQLNKAIDYSYNAYKE